MQAVCMQQKHTQLARLLDIMARLRDPETGCPWDVKQSFETIAPYTIEEAYEVSEAIASGDRDKICDELGDLLLQVVFHAQMATEDEEALAQEGQPVDLAGGQVPQDDLDLSADPNQELPPDLNKV